MKQYIFKVTKSFKDLVDIYSIEGTTDLDVGEECAEHGIWYHHLQAWFYDEELEELEVFIDD